MAEETKKKDHSISHFLFIMTIIQFWWIAIWGIAYILIDLVAGSSRLIEFGLYIATLVLMTVYIHSNPEVIEWF
jgi:hypothetical protein